MAKADLTAARLRELLDYDPLTGVFRWRVPKAVRCKVGSIAGGPTAKGYWKLKIDGVFYRAHRLAFLYMTGHLPPSDMDVDHIDCQRNNNAWTNLRILEPAQNRQNRLSESGVGKSKRLGVTVQTYKDSRYFQANIKVGGVNKYLGSFPTEEAAADAYMKAKRELHPAYSQQ